MDISTELAKIKLENPTVLASGILGASEDMLERVSKLAGAVTIKSVGFEPKEGHKNPTVVEFEAGLLNAVGLPTPGYKNLSEELKAIQKMKKPVIMSIYGGSINEFVAVTEEVVKYRPALVELNISCPNTEKHGMLFGVDPDTTYRIVSAVKKAAGNVPVMPKLTPNCTDIVAIAKACEKAGADAICAINTVGPGMLINIDAKKPVLAYKRGGVSGPAIRPIAVRCVYDIYANTKLPILGMGGVMNGRDVIEMMMAGASAVGIGTAVYYYGTDVFNSICGEIKAWMKKNKVDSIKKVIGAAHES